MTDPVSLHDAITLCARELGATVTDDAGRLLVVPPDRCPGCNLQPLLCACPFTPDAAR